MRTLLLVAALAVVTSSTGCGLRYRVDRSDLDRIPPEDKLGLFDAENDVLIAKDEMAAAKADKEDTRKALSDAESQASLLQKRASSEKDPKIAGLLRKWATQKLEWRKADVALAEARADAADAVLMAARARYERAKAVVMKERAPRLATGISIKDFDGQLKDRDQDAASGRKNTERVRAERDRKRASYDDVSRELQQLSGGAYGGPWAD